MEMSHELEIKAGQRFGFGDNWARFLKSVDEERIQLAAGALCRMLEVSTLAGQTFLDIGSGSGLMSLAARRLGAKVRSFDYDLQSVECTAELKRRYFPGDPDWLVEQGSVLDKPYMASLGRFDIVYSWGVLHHTGAMYEAMGNVEVTVKDKGKLFIAIYNNQGGQSRRWWWIKKTYNALPAGLRVPFALLVMLPREAYGFLAHLAKGHPLAYFSSRLHYAEHEFRGMNWWNDVIDWVGGFPFEVARPEEVFNFYREHGFTLTRLKTEGGGLGCNEFVFQASR